MKPTIDYKKTIIEILYWWAILLLINLLFALHERNLAIKFAIKNTLLIAILITFLNRFLKSILNLIR